MKPKQTQPRQILAGCENIENSHAVGPFTYVLGHKENYSKSTKTWSAPIQPMTLYYLKILTREENDRPY